MTISDADAAKVAKAVLDQPITLDGLTKPLSVWVSYGNRYALAALNATQDVGDKLGAVATVVNALPPRVAALQAAVAKLAPAATNVVVDVAAIAEAVVTRLAQKLGA